MLSVIGDETEDIIKLPNKMTIIIDYGDKNLNAYGISGRYISKYRRVRLFDKKGLLITELIEDNPHKENIPNNIFKDDNNII